MSEKVRDYVFNCLECNKKCEIILQFPKSFCLLKILFSKKKANCKEDNHEINHYFYNEDKTLEKIWSV